MTYEQIMFNLIQRCCYQQDRVFENSRTIVNDENKHTWE